MIGSLGSEPPKTCRWCAWLVVGDTCWCEEQEIAMSEAQASVPRKCRFHEPVAIDAITGARWDPRAKGGRVIDGQMMLSI